MAVCSSACSSAHATVYFLLSRGETRSSQITRRFEDLVTYLFRELSFPHGALLMTGTGLVPPDDFTLAIGDTVTIVIGSLTLENTVA